MRRRPPERPAECLNDFRLNLITDQRRRCYFFSHAWPCLKCEGRGKTYRTSPPWEWEKCQGCDGQGLGEREAVEALYEKAIQEYEAESQEYQRLTAALHAALGKLTAEEIDAIRELGL